MPFYDGFARKLIDREDAFRRWLGSCPLCDCTELERRGAKYFCKDCQALVENCCGD